MVLDYNVDYPAIYSFTNDAIDSFPSGWTGANVKVIAAKEFHNKNAFFYDDVSSTMNQYFATVTQRGIIEFWLYLSLNAGLKAFAFNTRDFTNSGF